MMHPEPLKKTAALGSYRQNYELRQRLGAGLKTAAPQHCQLHFFLTNVAWILQGCSKDHGGIVEVTTQVSSNQCCGACPFYVGSGFGSRCESIINYFQPRHVKYCEGNEKDRKNEFCSRFKVFTIFLFIQYFTFFWMIPRRFKNSGSFQKMPAATGSGSAPLLVNVCSAANGEGSNWSVGWISEKVVDRGSCHISLEQKGP